MIPVPLPPEPASFNDRVRREGLAHLHEQGQDPEQPAPRALFAMKRIMPNGGERSCEYWQLAREDLRHAYHNLCVYSCFQIEVETLASGKQVSMHSIDHFKPISLSPAKEAYNWLNLRWAWGVIDNHKGNSLIPDDHDPTRLQADALILSEDPSGLLIVATNHSPATCRAGAALRHCRQARAESSRCCIGPHKLPQRFHRFSADLWARLHGGKAAVRLPVHVRPAAGHADREWDLRRSGDLAYF